VLPLHHPAEGWEISQKSVSCARREWMKIREQ